MSTKPISRRALAAMEQESYQSHQLVRDQEDAKYNSEFNTRQNAIKTQLLGLYDQQAKLQSEMHTVARSIAYFEQEQERVTTEFNERRDRILAQRHEEDKSQEEWFAKAREASNGHEAVRPKSNGRRSSKGVDMAPATAATGGWTSINGSRRQSRRDEEEEEPPTDPGNLLSSVYHNPVDETETNGAGLLRNNNIRSQSSAAPNGVGAEDDYGAARARKSAERPLKPKQRHSLPTFTDVVRSPTGKPSIHESAASVMEPKARSPSGRKSLPVAKSSATPSKDQTEPNDGKEITRENLVIKDDGKVITEPPMYAGIPLERIDQGHEYWDPEWQSLESIIQPQLDKWKEKLDQLRRTPEAVRHTVFLANRQVNRGQSVIDFMTAENFHPYQFVGKEMMAKFYKTFINYDTMFRLVNVHEELKKFDLEVTPLDWLRQRMYEIAQAQGDKFSLSKTTHDLYHDAKLKVLRERNGYGNIGRPSGYKLGERNPDKAPKTKIKRESSGSTRKKARRSIGQVDSDDGWPVEQLQQGLSQPPQEVLEPVTPRLQKRQRLEPALPPPEPEDNFDFSGYTSTDSFSAGRIMHLDWRVYQIKTRTLTTSTEVTQYWTWKPDDSMFEHQVLRDVYPKVTWGFYQKPIDFNLKLSDLIEIHYAPDCQKIHCLTRDEKRGNILAHFKRERTRKRFLTFAKKKNVKLVRYTSLQIEEAWNTMESETLPNEESDT